MNFYVVKQDDKFNIRTEEVYSERTFDYTYKSFDTMKEAEKWCNHFKSKAPKNWKPNKKYWQEIEIITFDINAMFDLEQHFYDEEY